jgi:hypothetical protein
MVVASHVLLVMRRLRSEAGLICRIATLRRRDRCSLQRAATSRSGIASGSSFALGRFLGFEQRENYLKPRGLLLLFFSQTSPPLVTWSAYIALDLVQSIARGNCQPLNHHPQNSVSISVKMFP